MTQPLRLVEVAHASNTGRVRTHNEDRSFAEPPVLAVADGMGGAKAGEVAAQIAIDAVAQVAKEPTARALHDRLVAANDEILREAGDHPSRMGMGTTITAALLDGGAATLMHVGDSRGYLIREGRLRQLTDDHSIVAEMVRQGQLSPDDAQNHPSRNIITRALGAEPTVEIDEVTVDLVPGDIVLLCSDGLSSLVGDPEIERAIVGAPDLQRAAQALVSAALSEGGTDNVTVVLGLVGGDRDAEAPGGTSELPVVGAGAAESDADAEPGEVTAPVRIPPPPDSRPKASRTPVVLEPTATPRRRMLRRGVGVGVVVLALLAAFGTWAASRTYFVDGAGAGTVRVYHGAPFSIGGIDLFAEWADTGVPAATVTAAEPGALGRTARGKGEAVQRAVELTWRYGLGEVPVITVPPPPPKPTAPRRAVPTPGP